MIRLVGWKIVTVYAEKCSTLFFREKQSTKSSLLSLLGPADEGAKTLRNIRNYKHHRIHESLFHIHAV
jgi:hypothetical protein